MLPYFVLSIPGPVWWGHWRARRSAVNRLCMETQLQMLQHVEEFMLHHLDIYLWNLHRLLLGLLLCMHCLLSYLAHNSLYEGLWDQCRHLCKGLLCYYSLLLWSMLWSLWKNLSSLQKIELLNSPEVWKKCVASLINFYLWPSCDIIIFMDINNLNIKNNRQYLIDSIAVNQ